MKLKTEIYMYVLFEENIYIYLVCLRIDAKKKLESSGEMDWMPLTLIFEA